MRVVQAAAAHEQVAEHYRRKIRRGQLKPGGPLPSVRTIAETWSVSTRTAWRAVTVLRDAGWVDVTQGRQALVLGVPAQRQMDSARSGDVAEIHDGQSPARLRLVKSPALVQDSSGETRWLAAHRRQILAIAREALTYRGLGNAEAVEGLTEVEGELNAGRLTPGSFSMLQLALADLGFSPGRRSAAADHPVHALMDRWSALYAEHPSQRPER